MWTYKEDINYQNYYRKIIFVKLKTRKRHSFGIFERISNRNLNGNYTITLGLPEGGYDNSKHHIATDIIESIYYDNSISIIGKLNLIKDSLSDRLNDDIFGVIKNLLGNEIIYL
mgnify:CR=1 FL=1|tara:strand:+ start:82 stop:423 length:342 start_codon:yes stop_codon:yes gene_type:complete